METKEDLFNHATDLANCILADAARKRRARSTILRLIVMGIQTAKLHPEIERELELMAEYSEI